MNKTETVIATNESMNAYCSEITNGKITIRSVVISRTPRHYFDLCDLLDTITTRQAKTIKGFLFDALVDFPKIRTMGISITCFLKGCTEDTLFTMMRNQTRCPQRLITVKKALSDPDDYTVKATLIVRRNQYREIEQQFFPDLHKK